jgi:hypothetical protein
MHQPRPLAAALVCGSIASASGVVVQIAGHEGDGKAVIAAVSQSLSTIATIPLTPSPIATVPPSPSTIATAPPSPSTTPSAVVSPPPPAMRAPVKRQESASPSNSPQTTRLDAFAPAVTASTTAATTDQAEQPVPAPKKSQKAARGANERNRGWNDAAAWGPLCPRTDNFELVIKPRYRARAGITLLPTLLARVAPMEASFA